MSHLISRVDTIVNLCRDKHVLDIGSTGQAKAYELWPLVSSVAKSITGIDIVEHDDENIVLGNMETYDFKKKFDVIVVGDTIEHVHNQGLFLANLRKHLKNDGKLIITTPNAKWFTVMLKPNPTHVLWHDKYTLKYILSEYGLDIEQFAFYLGNKRYALPVMPFVWRQGMLVVCTKSKEK